MTDRATARHRAPQAPSTPLTSISTGMSDRVTSLGRGGVVLAMSSGLVATMGLPAQAVSKAAGPQEAAAGAAVLPAAPSVAAHSAFLAVPAAFTAGGAVKAPAAAEVEFASDSFTAVPTVKKKAPARSTSAGSRSGSRSPLSASVTSSGAGSARGSSAIALAARYLGVPYVYGGTTPSGWDCSGSVGYIYRQLGYSLPRTANDQMNATRRISRSEARPGDLVFILSGGRAYHMGIFAGGNMFYDAGRSGRVFSKRAIFSSNVVFGRVG